MSYGLKDIDITTREKKGSHVVYEFDVKAFFHGDPDEFEKVLDSIKKTFRQYMTEILKGERKEDKIIEEGKAEALLEIMSDVEKLIDRGKLSEARAWFEILKVSYPTLKENPRFHEVEDTFVMIMDKLYTAEDKDIKEKIKR